MIGHIARFVSLRVAASLIVAVALPVGFVAASGVVSHPATPGHSAFTTPDQVVPAVATPSPSILTAEATETPEPTESPEATESPDATASTAATDATDSASTARPTDNHGWLVSQAAQDSSKVGGRNDNHGGYVSAIARGDHGPCATGEPGESDGHAEAGRSGHASQQCIAPLATASPSASPTALPTAQP